MGGYDISEIGETVTSSKSNFNFTRTLLSVRQLQGQQQYTFDSILVVSVLKNESFDFEVSCTNNNLINTTGTDKDPVYRSLENINMTRNITLGYVLAVPILYNTSLLTHIFVCSSDSSMQTLGINKRAIGFNSQDPIGEKRNVLSSNNEIVKLQAILISQLPSQTTTLAFVTQSSNFSFICSFETTAAELPSRNISSSLYISTSKESHASTEMTKTTTSEVDQERNNSSFWFSSGGKWS